MHWVHYIIAFYVNTPKYPFISFMLKFWDFAVEVAENVGF